MKMKTNLLALSCLALAVSCNSDNDSSKSTGAVESQENQNVVINTLNNSAKTLQAEASKFEKIAPLQGDNTPALSINPHDQIDEDPSTLWWSDANVWKIRDPKVACTGDFAECNAAIISPRNYVARDLDKAQTESSIKSIQYPTNLLCIIGNGIDAKNFTDKKLNYGQYEINVSSSLATSCNNAIAVGTKIAVESQELANASQYYDSKLVLKISTPNETAHSATLFVRDSETATNIAMAKELESATQKTFILFNKEFNLFRAENFLVPKDFTGTTQKDQQVELTRLYRNANGLAVVFRAVEDSLQNHGREIFSYGLKGNTDYPELSSQVTVALSNYREVTDTKMACLEKAENQITMCEVGPEITYWNALEQVNKIYGAFNAAEFHNINENSFINFLSETEVISAQPSMN